MSKYADLISDVEGVFGTTAWTTTGINTFPSNFIVPSTIDEFVKIELVPLGPDQDYARFGLDGIVIIQVYITANQGIRRLMEIADLLDGLLQNVSLNNGTKTESSSFQVLGQDKDNPNLYRGDYSVNFKFYN